MTSSQLNRRPNIFISHKHADVAIADVFQTFVKERSLGNVAIYQSSNALAEGPTPGRALTGELKKALWEAGVVFLVYTSEDHDWGWCMWECGVATKADSPNTNLIVIQCGPEAPRVFADQVRVNARDKNDVLGLVKRFLTDVSFFPENNGAIAPNLSPDGPEVLKAAADLHAKLAMVLPTAAVAEWSAQPLLRLEVPLTDASRIEHRESGAPTLDEVARVHLDDKARQIFGLETVEQDSTLQTLARRWQDRRPGKSLAWLEEIRSHMLRSLSGEIAPLKWAYMSAVNDASRYAPVLSRVRRLPAKGVIQFDFNLLAYDSLTATPVTSRMISRASMISVDLEAEPLSQLRLLELAQRFDRQHASRIPVLDSAGRAHFVVHRSMIDRYIASSAIRKPDAKLADLTLESMLADDGEVRRMLEKGFDLVGADSRLIDAAAKMNARRECQDVFVTSTGKPEEPILGWITNVMLTQGDDAG